jgi:2-polyprenyl-6-hydroxyphenyl methylase/3-demethylubiquinone-9 3-methyltransferase
MSSKPALTDRLESASAEEFLWDDAAPAEAHGYLEKPVRSLLDTAAAGRVLDLGCGNGALTARLAAPGRQLTGLDHSTSGIRLARERHAGIAFDPFDILAPLPAQHHGRYDAVVSAEVVEHLLLPRKLMERAREALAPDGLLIVTTPFHGYWKNLALALSNGFDSHWHPLRDYGHVKFFSRRTLLRLFEETGFAVSGFRTAGRIPALACSMIAWGRKIS